MGLSNKKLNGIFLDYVNMLFIGIYFAYFSGYLLTKPYLKVVKSELLINDLQVIASYNKNGDTTAK